MRTLTDADAARHADAIAEAGFTIVHDAFDPALGREVIDRLDHLVDELGVEPATNSFEGSVLPIVDRMLDEQCLLSTTR